MAKPNREEKIAQQLNKLRDQILIILADYQTMKAYTYGPKDVDQRTPLDAAYFAHGGEGLRLEIAQRIDDNARIIFNVPRVKR